LPRRVFQENTYAQFSERFPGIVMEQDRVWCDRSRDLDPELTRLYAAYLDDDLSYGETSAGYALGLHTFAQRVSEQAQKPAIVKGQVIWPISWGLTVVDLIEEVLGGLHGIRMVHCCGNTDWSLLLATSTQILSFDAYDYAVNLALYPTEIEAFLARGGILAWGITPNSPAVWNETVDSLVERLLAAMGLLVQKGFRLDDILGASLISPACGLGPVSEELADRIVVLTSGVSRAMRARYL
jgi:hypothetical protein